MAQRIHLQCRKCGFDPWVRKIPWRRKWLPIPVFLPGTSHGQRSLMGCSPWDHKSVGHNLATKQQQCSLRTCCCSVAQSCPSLCNLMNCSTPGFPVLHDFLDFAQTHVTESVMPSNDLILCHSLLLLPSIFPSIRVFANESALLIRRPKYWSFSFNISPSNEHPGLISFGMDWLMSLQSKGLSRLFSNITVQKHQFNCIQLSLGSNSHIHT